MQSIFEELVNPPSPTLAEKKSQVADDLVNRTRLLAASLVQELNKLFIAAWGQQNQWGMTPPQVADGLGERGLSLFQTHGAMVSALPSICSQVTLRPYEPGQNPGPLEVFVPPADWQITYETDDAGQPTGRVILTEVE